MRRSVWFRNLKDEEIMDRIGPQRNRKQKLIMYHGKANLQGRYPVSQNSLQENCWGIHSSKLTYRIWSLHGVTNLRYLAKQGRICFFCYRDLILFCFSSIFWQKYGWVTDINHWHPTNSGTHFATIFTTTVFKIVTVIMGEAGWYLADVQYRLNIINVFFPQVLVIKISKPSVS